MKDREMWEHLGLLQAPDQQAAEFEVDLAEDLTRRLLEEVGGDLGSAATVIEEQAVVGQVPADAVQLMRRVAQNRDLFPGRPLTVESLLSLLRFTYATRSTWVFPPPTPSKRCYRCVHDATHVFAEEDISGQPTAPDYYCPLHEEPNRPGLAPGSC